MNIRAVQKRVGTRTIFRSAPIRCFEYCAFQKGNKLNANLHLRSEKQQFVSYMQKNEVGSSFGPSPGVVTRVHPLFTALMMITIVFV